MASLLVVGALWALAPPPTTTHLPISSAPPIASALPAAALPAVYFQFPLPTWGRHCLGFGSQWRYCNGTPLRTCPVTGAVWLHTGVDIRTGLQPVRAAANGVIVGYIVDPTFRGGVLIRHQTPQGVVLT